MEKSVLDMENKFAPTRKDRRRRGKTIGRKHDQGIMSALKRPKRKRSFQSVDMRLPSPLELKGKAIQRAGRGPRGNKSFAHIFHERRGGK